VCAILLIRDGDPWWLSPDIWTVPGDDPNGVPATPAVGQPTFAWARLWNNGEVQIENVELNFYWSNPATGILRSNSTLIGSAFATVPGGESREVLCLTPWVPACVNDGHECLVIEAIHPSDPLPSPLPDPFAPPSYDQIAQRNICLVRMAAQMMRAIPIQIALPERLGRMSAVRIRREREPLDGMLLKLLGLGDLRFDPEETVRAGLLAQPELSCDAFDPKEMIKLELKSGTTTAVYLALKVEEISPDSYSWLSIIEDDAETEETVGGISYVITGRKL
jgi:hypothetical protein